MGGTPDFRWTHAPAETPCSRLHTHGEKTLGGEAGLSDSILAAASASEREFLEALRDHLAGVLDASPPAHTIAGITKQLMEVRKALQALESAEGGDDIGTAVSTPDAKFDSSAL